VGEKEGTGNRFNIEGFQKLECEAFGKRGFWCPGGTTHGREGKNGLESRKRLIYGTGEGVKPKTNAGKSTEVGG